MKSLLIVAGLFFSIFGAVAVFLAVVGNNSTLGDPSNGTAVDSHHSHSTDE